MYTLVPETGSFPGGVVYFVIMMIKSRMDIVLRPYMVDLWYIKMKYYLIECYCCCFVAAVGILMKEMCLIQVKLLHMRNVLNMMNRDYVINRID